MLDLEIMKMAVEKSEFDTPMLFTKAQLLELIDCAKYHPRYRYKMIERIND